MQKNRIMTKTLAHGYLSESTQWELSHEYQHDRVWTGFKNLCILCALDESNLSNGLNKKSESSCSYSLQWIMKKIIDYGRRSRKVTHV